MKLPKVFKPDFDYKLSRIGSKHDGGYLIENSSIEKAKFLISFGISTNWDFEKEFINYKDIRFLAFDGSIDEIFWKKNEKIAYEKLLRLSFIRYFKFKLIKKSFHQFFNKNNLIPKYISKTLENSMNLLDVLNICKYKNNLFFKIDIEGSEYEILDDLIQYQEKIIGLAIEFHECNKNFNKIISFIEKFNLKLVHVHANNYDNNTEYKIPNTLEISFSRDPIPIKKFSGLPHKLDSPNRARNKEIKLSFYE